MKCKVCPGCKKRSYSATTKGKWICPYCEKDITLIKVLPINKRPSKAKLSLVKSKAYTELKEEGGEYLLSKTE